MPEGPSILLLKEAVQPFVGKKIIKVSGNSKIDIDRLKGKTIVDFKTWGKHFLICFDDFTIRIHMLMFGSYSINEKKDRAPRLSMQFRQGEINFYTCSVKVVEEKLDEIYDWSADVMNPLWNARKAANKLKKLAGTMVCDALLDQDIFAGVGNIIKNEVLFRIKVHPESDVSKLPARQTKALIKEAVTYSFEFLEWKRAFVLKKHWLAYNKKICPRDAVPFIKENTGKKKRRSFYCTQCQQLY